MECLARTLTEQVQQQSERMQPQSERMQQKQQEQMLQQEHRLKQRINSSINTLKDQSDTTNSTLTDMSARLERLERASSDLNPVELRTNPSVRVPCCSTPSNRA